MFRNGQILIFSIVAMAILMIFSIALLRFERTNNNIVYSHTRSEQAYYLALSGINYIKAHKDSCAAGVTAGFNLHRSSFGFDGYIHAVLGSCSLVADRTSTGYYTPVAASANRELDFFKTLSFTLGDL